MYDILEQATEGTTDPMQIVTDLDDLTGRLIYNELTVSAVYVSVLAIQSITHHLSAIDTDFRSNGYLHNTIVWVENSEKFTTKYINHFDPFARDRIIKYFDYVVLMIRTLQNHDDIIYHLPEEEDLQDIDSCPDKLQCKIRQLSSVLELDEVVINESCVICLESVDQNNYVVLDVCGHYFCKTCIDPWFSLG